MNYLLDRNTVFKNRNRPKSKSGLLVLMILVILVVSILFFKSVAPLAVSIVKPINTVSNIFPNSIGYFSQFLKKQDDLVRENENLISQINELKLEKIIWLKDKDELSFLRETVGRYSSTTKPIIAEVLSRPIDLPFDLLLIDVGRNDFDQSRLGLGMKVALNNEIILGEVVNVYSRTSRIKMYSSPNSRLRAYLGEDNIPVVVEGVGGGSFIASVPRGLEIKSGDLVNIKDPFVGILGYVKEVDDDDRHPFQQVFISIPVNINQLKWLEVHND